MYTRRNMGVHYSKEKSMKILDGWKTIIGGLGLILTGLGMIAVCVKSDNYTNLPEALSTIAAGMGVLGIGGKIVKATPKT